MRFGKTLIIAGALGLSLPCGTSRAAETLLYGRQVSARVQEQVHSFLALEQGTADRGTGIAPADLNGDGLEEYILRTGRCREGSKFCTFYAVAEVGDRMVALGTFIASRIILADSYTSGVRNLMVFENPANDYDFNLYVWEALKSGYTQKER